MQMTVFSGDRGNASAWVCLLSFGFLAAALFSFISTFPAEAAKRVALVIGNDSYESVPVLQKARNDARSMAEALTNLGYDVISAKDVGRRAMSRALVEFERKIGPGDIALFFFAGHGFAIEGTNYLLPVDVPKAGPGEKSLVRDASFAADGLADRMRDNGAATAVQNIPPPRRHRHWGRRPVSGDLSETVARSCWWNRSGRRFRGPLR